MVRKLFRDFWQDSSTELCHDAFHDRADLAKEAINATKAYRDLDTCYRMGKRPTEALFSRLEMARALLTRLGGRYE